MSTHADTLIYFFYNDQPDSDASIAERNNVWLKDIISGLRLQEMESSSDERQILIHAVMGPPANKA